MIIYVNLNMYNSCSHDIYIYALILKPVDRHTIKVNCLGYVILTHHLINK